ncbi:MAG TPA: hypothetical protein VFQ84_09335 [Arenimonas sp.]|uniref:hypothetical protein n=1 Tax=Arenimonas sp. TaxID=1872635 RepID=UPI002D80286D|nr:hypothetical protein [Arenimonas sp.]HEU0153534.1 hypothetical protein [Arenimonas sp.]
MTRTRRALALLLAIALCLTWLRLANERERLPAPPAANEAVATRATLDTPPPPPTPAPAPGAAPVPLPPADAPFALVAEELIARADAGDRSAACRVGVELMFCESMRTLPSDQALGQLAQEEASATARGDLDKADQMARAQARLISRREQCAQRPPTPKGGASHYLRQAALAGHPDAMRLYTEGVLFEMQGPAHVRDPLLDAWRREAPDLLRREIERGNLTVPVRLALAHDSDVNLGDAVVPDDAFLSEAYQQLALRLVGTPPTPFRSLPPDEFRRALALADRWHRDHYGGRVDPGLKKQVLTVMPAIFTVQDALVHSNRPICRPR